LLVVVLTAITLAQSDVSPALAAPDDVALTYRLADTWANAPWRREAGRFGAAIDISSPPRDPQGPLYVLDGRQRAVHVLAPDGRPIGVFDVTAFGADDEPWIVQRLDVGFDGTLYVLSASVVPAASRRHFRTRVDRLAPDGRRLARVELLSVTPYAFRDLAVRDDGRLYLSRVYPAAVASPPGAPGPTPDPLAPLRAVDVLDPDGRLADSLSPPEMVFPDSVDVAADGTVYVVNRLPANFAGPGPGPTPEPRPSGRPAPAQGPKEAVEGVMVFEPDHRYRETVPFTDAEDVAVGPAGVFVSRNVEIFALRERGPMFTGPIAFTGSLGGTIFRLDAPADGRLLASMAHCYAQGVVMIGDPAARPAAGRIAGLLDQPELEGPVFPLRIGASEDVAVLQGRFATDRTGPQTEHHILPFARQPQTVQRWTRAGVPTRESRLSGQLGLCSGLEGWWAQDVAVDGRDVYTVNPGQLQRRPDDHLPAWSVSPVTFSGDPEAPSRLVAVSADGGRVAALDGGAGEVLIVDRDGRLAARWPVAPAGGDEAAVDLALAARQGRVYLADQGASRILVRGLDGAALGAWPVHDGPRGVAVGPTGDVFVLGRGGWAFRYRPDGRLVAMWPMPDRFLEALDIAVDVDGRVYVNYLRRVPIPNFFPAGLPHTAYRIASAGVWVFEAAPMPVAPAPATEACVARPDKAAAPRRVPLGAAVDVTLAVAGRCPDRQDPAQVALVFDTSRSMGMNDALERAEEAALALLGALDPRFTEVALVTFGDAARLDAPLGRDLGALKRRIAALEAEGDSRLAAGLAVARAELTGPRANPAARRVAVLISDGAYKDDPDAAGTALRGAGVDLFGLIFGNAEFAETHRSGLERLIPVAGRLHFGPDPGLVASLVAGIAGIRKATGLFETMTVVDEIPRNMRYVADSAVPPAAYDPDARTLTWDLRGVPAGAGLALRYRLVPLEVGLWPTNVQAAADYRDAAGFSGRLVFPIPEVEVYAPPAFHAYLPFAAGTACLRPARPLEAVLVLDTSSSMAEPAPGGGTKLDAARAAAEAFVGLLDLGAGGGGADRVGVVSFNGSAARVLALTGDRARVAAALAGLSTGAGTRIDLGLAGAAGTLAEGGRAEAQAVVILLTDGLQTASEAPNGAVVARSEGLKAGGALVYTIGLGETIDRELLRAVATSADRYYESPTTDELAAIYRAISARLACEGG